MTIIEARAISYQEMINLAQRKEVKLLGTKPIKPEYEEVHIISITDHNLPKIF
jgi:hypothetical protein